MMPLKASNRRYYLHRRLRKQKGSFSAANKTIFQPVNKDIESKYVLELQQEFNYSIQLTIPNE